jgi:hypothetical protein
MARNIKSVRKDMKPKELPKAGHGYIVKRSNARKGKTHVVIGPDGTKKYFGDSHLGQHPNDPKRKKAFYARHAKNLKNNPYFRAFARKTWADGGLTPENDPLDIQAITQNPYMNKNLNQEESMYSRGGMIKRADGHYSQHGLWDSIRENKGSGKKPTKEMLEQEKKIKSKKQNGGSIGWEIMEEGGKISKKLKEASGNPTVILDPSIPRSYYDPITNSINSSNRNEIFGEYAHAIQNKRGEFRNNSDFFEPDDSPYKKPTIMDNEEDIDKEGNNAASRYYNRRANEIRELSGENFDEYNKLFNLNTKSISPFLSKDFKENKADKMIYMLPGTVEYEAHSLIEPQIRQNEKKYKSGGRVKSLWEIIE